jgi:hypothetical protein
MNTQIVNIIKRLFILLLIQLLILKHINIGWSDFNYIHLFIYPLFILLIPIKIQRSVLLILAFFTGLTIDMFYDSPGLHASSLVFMSYIRKYILKFLEPIEGYNIESTPSIRSFGFNWFLIYSSVLVFINVFWYFSMEAFSFHYFTDIILKTIFSFIFSEIIIVLYVVILNPK